MAASKKFPGAGQWDSINATYKWKIYLTNQKELTGYSKGLYVSEPMDKTVLLERCIRRLANSGYFQIDRVKYIQFFFNRFLNGNDEMILIMFPDKYTLGNNERIVSDKRLADFFTLFYRELLSGKEVMKNIIHPIKRSQEEELFDWRIRRFKDEASLHKFVIAQIQNYPNSELPMDYFRKYKQEHPFPVDKPVGAHSKIIR